MSQKAAPSSKPVTTLVVQASRFREQFNDETAHDLPTKQATYPTHVVKSLKIENKNVKKPKAKISRRRTSLATTSCSRVSKSSSTVSALAHTRHGRDIAKAIVSKHREAKRTRREHEKCHKRKSWLAGAMWGYDPMAGRISETYAPEGQSRGCYVFTGNRSSSDDYGVAEVDMLGRRTGRRWLDSDKWGIECGGPGQQPCFGSADEGLDPSTMFSSVPATSQPRRNSYNPWIPNY